jgi:RecJ-like exonuclease
MTEIPKNKISCKICKYRGESPISGTCEGCNHFSKFEIDYDKVCKWCYNPAAPDDNICAEHRKSHAAHSWPDCIEFDKERQNNEKR